MKRPQPDIGDRLKGDFLRNLGTARKLLRLWGTTTIDGVEVLHPRRYYYPEENRPANYKKLFEYLGAYDDIEANFDPKGLEYAWLYFNRSKAGKLPVDGGGNDLYSNYTTFVSDNLNKVWWNPADGAMPAGLTLTTAVVIQPSSEMARLNPGLVKIEDLIAQELTDTALIAAIEANFSDLWQTSRVIQQGLGAINKGSLVDPYTGGVTPDEDDLSASDPWMATLARYAIGDAQITATITDVAIGLNIGRKFGIQPEADVIANTVAVTVEIDYYNFVSSSTLVDSVSQDLYSMLAESEGRPTLGGKKGKAPSKRTIIDNKVITRQAILEMSSSDLETDVNIINRPYLLWDTASDHIDPIFDSIWQDGAIKADVLRNPSAYGLKYSNLNNYILSILESGVKKEKVPLWKKVTAVVIFVIVLVYSYGTQAQTAIGFAKAVLYASIVLSVITLVLSLAGATEWASAFASASKALEPLVIVATIVLIVTGIQKGVKEFTKELGKKTVPQILADTAVRMATDLIDDIIKGATSLVTAPLGDAAIKFATTLLNILDIGNKNRLASIQSRNNDLRVEYEQLLAEGYQENDILQGFMLVYARPATADWSMYAAQFDIPYERGGGVLALGNIQRTTYQALRKGSYDDPAFANILVA